MGLSNTIGGWRGVVTMVVLPLPVIAMIAWNVRGLKDVRRRVYREEGLYCVNCGSAPEDGEQDFVDWVELRACRRCGGRLARYETTE